MFRENLDCAKTFFSQGGENGQIILLGSAGPPGDGTPGESFREQAVKEEMCLRFRERLLLQRQCD